MLFVSGKYLVFLAFTCAAFYGTPVKHRKKVLLLASLLFVGIGCGPLLLWLVYAALTAYGGGRFLETKKGQGKRRLFLGVIVLLLLLPLAGFKWGGLLWAVVRPQNGVLAIAAPLGISFYTLSLIGYCVDIYRGQYEAQRKLSRFLLFVVFFPHSVQGPIARYGFLRETLYREQRFCYTEFCHGCQLVLWGFFQKLVVADRLAVLVNHVFAPERERAGFYVLLACVAYSFQLYTDFLGCVNIALGSAQLFGIRLEHNFAQPYFALSIRDFWRRWHMTLGSWLRDYVYIPLGGNRRGKLRKRCNLLLTFAVSGLWHGAGLHYLAWGILHGLYQVAEDILGLHDKGAFPITGWRRRIFCLGRMALTFALVTFGWALFRANSVSHFLHMMGNMVSVFNPQVLMDGAAFELSGITRTGILPAVAGLFMVLVVDVLHEKNINLRQTIDRLCLPLRWCIYVGGVALVVLFGTYGPGYTASQFIYGKF